MSSMDSELVRQGCSLIDAEEFELAREIFIQFSNDPVAQYHLGEIFFNDDSHEDHLDHAFDWYFRSATNGFKHAFFHLGYFYEHGWGTDEDLVKAKFWYLKASKGTCAASLHRLGVIHSRGIAGAPDFIQAYCFCYLAFMMTDREDYKASLLECEEHLTNEKQEAALVLADDWIANHYKEKSQGLKRDVLTLFQSEETFELLSCKGKDSLCRGLLKASIKLIEHGDFEQARMLFVRHDTEPLGLYMLGLTWSLDAADAENQKIAFDFFMKSAELGCSLALFNVGWCYAEGIGVNQSAKEAFYWYLKAANLGDSYAQFNLAQMLAIHVEISRDYKQAYAWFFISKYLGNDHAEQWIFDSFNKLSVEQRDSANAWVEKWVTAKFDKASELDHPDFRKLGKSEEEKSQ